MDADRTTDNGIVTHDLAEASARLVRTVDGFHADDWSAPSRLPGWTRAHVVAHLGLNAAGMARALHGIVADDDEVEPRTMYDSDEQRAQDIAELATADTSDLRGRLLAGVTILQDAIDAVPDDQWETRVERTPGGRTMRAGALPGMRWRELEIHHVDLDAGYTTAAWSNAFAEHLLDAMVTRLRPDEAFEVKPHDSGRTWVVGDGEAEYPVPVVAGPAADLGWWLTGRPAPDTWSCSRGELPSITRW
jgi:maleylpyruvate isomerase